MEQSRAARLVQSLANTVDVENGVDELATAGDLVAWLRAERLVGTEPRVTARELARWHAVRDGFREALRPDGRPHPHVLAAADTALRDVPLLLTLAGPEPLLPEPGAAAALAPLARVAAAWAELSVTGELARLRQCADGSCAWVFWDQSRNRSRRWCSMRACGNRAKVRAHAAAHRAG